MTSETVFPPALRLATALVALEAAALLGLGVVYAVRGFVGAPESLVGAELGAVLILGLGVLLALVARGLGAARSWARSPALVVQLLAALTAFSLAQGGVWLPALGLAAASLGTLACLLSAPVRAVLDPEGPSGAR